MEGMDGRALLKSYEEEENKEREKKEREETKQRQIQDDLTRLRTWDTEGGQTLQEQRRGLLNRLIPKQHETANMRLRQDALLQIGAANAGEAADGMPGQEQTPAKKTYKQRREETRRANEARKISKNPNADHVSYNMVERLQSRENAAEAYVNEKDRADKLRASRVPPELVKAFYKDGSSSLMNYVNAVVTEKKAEEEERMAAVQDKEKAQNKILGAQMQRRAAVKLVVDEMLKTEITSEMFTDAYLEAHIDEMKALADQMRGFRDVIRADQNNKIYFNENNAETLRRVALLDAKLELADAFCAQLDYVAGKKAVDVGKGGYLKESPGHDHSQELARKLEDLQRTEQKIFEEAAGKEMGNLVGGVKKQRSRTQTPSDAAQRCTEVLEGMEKIFRENPENYDKYKGAAGSLYQEAYRLTDVIADLADQAEAYRQVCGHSRDSEDILKKGIADSALAGQKECEERIAALEKQLGTYTGALEYYLKGGSAVSRDMSKLVFENARDGACMTELLERAFLDKENGYIKESDDTYQKQGRGDAIAQFGFRSSGSVSDLMALHFGAEEALQGTAEESVNYFRQENLTAARASADMMDEFRERLMGKAGMDYVRSMLPYVKDAQVFQEDMSRIQNENAQREEGKKEVTDTAVAMLVQNLMLKFTGRMLPAVFTETQGQGAGYRTAAAVNGKIQKVTAWVGTITPEKEAALSDDDKNLLAKYRAMVGETADRLGLDTAARNASDAAANVDNAAVN